MAKSILLRPMHRKRGNPNWGQPLARIPAAATEFEKRVRELGLTKETYLESAELRDWCERHRNQCFIPEWLLEAWGIEADSQFGA
jgi:hypothetical protein